MILVSGSTENEVSRVDADAALSRRQKRRREVRKYHQRRHNQQQREACEKMCGLLGFPPLESVGRSTHQVNRTSSPNDRNRGTSGSDRKASPQSQPRSTPLPQQNVLAAASPSLLTCPLQAKTLCKLLGECGPCIQVCRATSSGDPQQQQQQHHSGGSSSSRTHGSNNNNNNNSSSSSGADTASGGTCGIAALELSVGRRDALLPVLHPLASGTHLDRPPSNFLSVEPVYRIYQYAPGFHRQLPSALQDLIQYHDHHHHPSRAAGSGSSSPSPMLPLQTELPPLSSSSSPAAVFCTARLLQRLFLAAAGLDTPKGNGGEDDCLMDFLVYRLEGDRGIVAIGRDDMYPDNSAAKHREKTLLSKALYHLLAVSEETNAMMAPQTSYTLPSHPSSPAATAATASSANVMMETTASTFIPRLGSPGSAALVEDAFPRVVRFFAATAASSNTVGASVLLRQQSNASPRSTGDEEYASRSHSAPSTQTTSGIPSESPLLIYAGIDSPIVLDEKNSAETLLKVHNRREPLPLTAAAGGSSAVAASFSIWFEAFIARASNIGVYHHLNGVVESYQDIQLATLQESLDPTVLNDALTRVLRVLEYAKEHSASSSSSSSTAGGDRWSTFVFSRFHKGGGQFTIQRMAVRPSAYPMISAFPSASSSSPLLLPAAAPFLSRLNHVREQLGALLLARRVTPHTNSLDDMWRELAAVRSFFLLCALEERRRRQQPFASPSSSLLSRSAAWHASSSAMVRVCAVLFEAHADFLLATILIASERQEESNVRNGKRWDHHWKAKHRGGGRGTAAAASALPIPAGNALRLSSYQCFLAAEESLSPTQIHSDALFLYHRTSRCFNVLEAEEAEGSLNARVVTRAVDGSASRAISMKDTSAQATTAAAALLPLPPLRKHLTLMNLKIWMVQWQLGRYLYGTWQLRKAWEALQLCAHTALSHSWLAADTEGMMRRDAARCFALLGHTITALWCSQKAVRVSRAQALQAYTRSLSLFSGTTSSSRCFCDGFSPTSPAEPASLESLDAMRTFLLSTSALSEEQQQRDWTMLVHEGGSGGEQRSFQVAVTHSAAVGNDYRMVLRVLRRRSMGASGGA